MTRSLIQFNASMQSQIYHMGNLAPVLGAPEGKRALCDG